MRHTRTTARLAAHTHTQDSNCESMNWFNLGFNLGLNVLSLDGIFISSDDRAFTDEALPEVRQSADERTAYGQAIDIYIAAQEEAREATQRIRKTWRRRLSRKQALELVKKPTGSCPICFEKADTRMIHDGTDDDPTKMDTCNFDICWECLHKSIAAQTAKYGVKKITPKCPGCNSSICYRVTFAEKPIVTRLRRFDAPDDKALQKMAAEHRMTFAFREDGKGHTFYKCVPMEKLEQFIAAFKKRKEKWKAVKEPEDPPMKEREGLSDEEWQREQKNWQDKKHTNWLSYWQDRFHDASYVGKTQQLRDALLQTEAGKELERKRVPTFKKRKRYRSSEGSNKRIKSHSL